LSESPALETIEIATGPAPDATIVWLHGLGADGNDFVPLVPELALDTKPGVRFVFPHAPQRAVTINMGMVMRAWYDVTSLELDRAPDVAGIEAAAAQVTQLLERELTRGITADRIILAGFSQGGVVAYHAGLRFAQRLAGLLALSCYLPLADRLDAEAADANRATPILHCHGTLDPLVPATLGEAAVTELRRRDYSVEHRTYPVEHGLHPQEVLDVAKWLRERLAR